jgi:hypothetical protein
MPNPKAGGPTLVSCLQLLIQYINSYPPYLEAVSFHSMRTCHAMVTRDPLNMEEEEIGMAYSTNEVKEKCIFSCHSSIHIPKLFKRF